MLTTLLALIVSILLGVIPMLFFAVVVYWFDRFEKEPVRLVIGAFFWGAVVAAMAALIINTTLGLGIFILTNSESLTDFTTASLIAPVVEESLKGFAVLLVFWFFRNEFDSVLDGIIYASITALGFAATENTIYIYSMGFLEGGWGSLIIVAFIRTIIVGWQHPFFTSFFGIGVSLARLNQNKVLKLVYPAIGWSIAIFTHSFHNLLASFGSGQLCILGTALDWSGWLAMFVFILFMIRREKKLLEKYLWEEIQIGTITQKQYYTAFSFWDRVTAAYKSIKNQNFQTTGRFYQLCAELSHKKYQMEAFGNEDGNGQIINSLRQQLAELNPKASA